MNEREWNEIVASFPDPHILQSWQWGKVKAYTGWEPIYRIWGSGSKPDAAAMILQKRVPLPGLTGLFKISYIPKGPLVRDWSNPTFVRQVFETLKRDARKQGVIFIKIDPDVSVGSGIPGEPEHEINQIGSAVREYLSTNGWHFSDEQIQFRNTVHLDLTPTEEEILANMKQKTRYNIRLSRRKGMEVRTGGIDDLRMIFQMYTQTALRDGFVIRDEGYYQYLWRTFIEPKRSSPNNELAPDCEPLIAEVDGEPVAAVVIFRFAGRAYYMHGMSTPIHRNKMPNYLLQWEAITRAKAAGCETYDLWGAPDHFEENDPMWGVFRFKQGLGGVVNRTIGAYDLPIKPVIYRIYTKVLPRILDVMRRQGVRKTNRMHGSDPQNPAIPRGG